MFLQKVFLWQLTQNCEKEKGLKFQMEPTKQKIEALEAKRSALISETLQVSTYYFASLFLSFFLLLCHDATIVWWFLLFEAG